MRFSPLFAAVLASAPTVLGGALFDLNPGDLNTDHIIDELSHSGIKNPDKPPTSKFPTLSPWSGGVIPGPPKDTFFNSVAAKITVPKLRLPKNADLNKDYSFGAWVGINGFAVDTLLQVGLIFDLTGANVDIKAFYQWTPQDSEAVKISSDEFAVHEEDVLYLRVETTDTGTVGVVSIDNQSTGQHFLRSLKAANNAALTGRTVEWIVEELPYPNSGGATSTPPDFLAITFSEALARAQSGQAYGPTEGGGVVVNYAPKLLPRVDPGQVVVTYYDP